jgi:AcrR family transcriptional regulator
MRSPPRSRGRPRSYDPEQALARARETFWRAGYAATSLDELANAMQMQRPSIYAAFGDKEQLYRTVAERYAASSCEAIARALASPATLRESLGALYAGAIDFYFRGDSARGCFLVGTALTEARGSQAIRALLERTFERFTELFEERFRTAARVGELSGASDARGLAQVATASLNTLSLRARSGASRQTLEALAVATIEIICGRSSARLRRRGPAHKRRIRRRPDW